MRNLFLLLLVMICLLAYVRAQQPATWNSWMVAAGENSFVVPMPAADSDAPGAPTAPDGPPTPARVMPVGGLIQNGNFLASNGHWGGDGAYDPSGKGLIVTLNPSSWTRIYQTFQSPGTQYSIEISYKLSPGFTVSQNHADYADISHAVRVAGYERFEPLSIGVGQFYGTVGDPNNMIGEEVYSPQLSSTGVQFYQHDYPAITATGTMTFLLAYPPGTGTVTLLTAYVTGH